MAERRLLDERSTGLNYNDNTFMIAGYLSDYELTFDEDILGALDRNEKTLRVADLKENRGYVDDNGYVHIFRRTPNKTEEIPWFTVITNSEGKPEFKFKAKVPDEVKNQFVLSRVGDLSIKRMIDETSPDEVIYSEEMKKNMLVSISECVTEIKSEDDFLKKLIKFMLQLRQVNPKQAYRGCCETPYQLNNLISPLNGTTRISPKSFDTWMELSGTDFEIILKDNGKDKNHPMGYQIRYDSVSNELTLLDQYGRILNDKGQEKEKVCVSAKQFR